ncbi:hypothetical protein KRX19_05770 [Cardiobacteriaceae bacterium TAE3-ERU3]|nr:hypothetical protein [Cardiobacteriaceae bacterium TAE3-ERU3]
MNFEIEELAWRACGLSDAEFEAKAKLGEDVEELLCETFGIGGDQFEQIVKALVKFVPPRESALTNTKYQGFADVELNRYIYKEEMK